MNKPRKGGPPLRAAAPHLFDRSRLQLRPLRERRHDLDLAAIRPLAPAPVAHGALEKVAAALRAAKQNGRAAILMMGAHVLRSGLQRYLMDFMERGWITCLAMNGAGVIHDYEMALAGATTESVSRYIADGQFGLWQETGALNEWVRYAAAQKRGLGEYVGQLIEETPLPHREISVLAAGFRWGIPVTVHAGIGYDIVHEHPNCDGAAWGAASYTDFLRFAHALESLEGGVVMNFGSAVMAPEIYLKALAMVRNVARQQGQAVRRFTTLVCDLVELPADFHAEPPKTSPGYYYRPWKTMLVRTVADGGASYYVRAPHAESLPALWTACQA